MGVLRTISDLTKRGQVLIDARAGYSRPMSELPDKLAAIRDVIQVLEKSEAPYALIGGLAVGIHSGAPRATLDVDIAVRSDVDRDALAQEMVRAGFELVGEFEHSINFRHRADEPVQLAFDLEFDAMIDHADAIEVDGLEIRVVTRDDLVTMKRRAAADPNRRRSKALRDEADIALLLGDVPDPDEGW